MNANLKRISYTFVAMSSLMRLTGDRKKRHVIGGVLLSVSLLFGGLALTVMSIKNEEKDDETID